VQNCLATQISRVNTSSSGQKQLHGLTNALAELPAAASAFMDNLADSHCGLQDQVVAEMCWPKDEMEELQRLREEGTDIARNAADPFGDGDQTPIRVDGASCVHSTLLAAVGNLFDLMEPQRVPSVVIHLLSGSVSHVHSALDTARAAGRLTEFLETRFACHP